MKISAVDPGIQEVRIDNQRGAGAVPLNQEVDYFGLRVMMRPSTFLRLALPLESDQYVKRIEHHIEEGGAIGAPFLSIDIPQAWEQTPPDFAGPAEVLSHDGRHRMMAIRRLEGDKPVEVHLFPRGLRNRDITPEWREALRRSMISQRSHNGVVRGPLFQDANAVTEAKEIKACGDCFKAAARNMLNRGDDDISLVHAYVSGQGKLQGRRFLHAWNEQGDTVIDNSNGRNIRLPREIYYAIGNIDPTDSAQFRRYDRQEAVRHMARSRHYGPWDLKETVNRVQPVVPVTKQYPTQQRPKDPPVPDINKLQPKQKPRSGVDLVAEQESDAYMSGHCHVMALALKSLHPAWQIRAHVGWDADDSDDSDYRVDHVYIVDPSTGAAYDCRGRFGSEQELVGPDRTGGVETQFVDYDLANIRDDIRRGELKPFTKQDVLQAASWYQNQLQENFADGKKPIANKDQEESYPSVEQAKKLMPQILARAQQDYDNWDESDRDTYAGGGICHIIADSICDVLGSAGINASPVSCNHEQHVYVAAQFQEGVYTIDIPYYVYEEGGGFSWRKLPDIKFDAQHVVFYRVSGDPAEFDEYIGLMENFADGKKPGRKGLAKRVGVDCRQPVSRLRKIAKSSSGERQRMAHWCANMKAGRQKSK